MTLAAAGALAGDYTGELIVVGSTVILAILGWIVSIILKRMREPTRIESLWTRVDELTKEIWGDPEKDTPGLKARVERAERRDAVKGKIIRSLSRQWPEVHTPRLDPDLLAELDEGLVPDHWLMKPIPPGAFDRKPPQT